MLEAYGVWQEKNLYGQKSMGIVRTTYLIDPEGKIRKVFPKVKVEWARPGNSGGAEGLKGFARPARGTAAEAPPRAMGYAYSPSWGGSSRSRAGFRL